MNRFALSTSLISLVRLALTTLLLGGRLVGDQFLLLLCNTDRCVNTSSSPGRLGRRLGLGSGASRFSVERLLLLLLLHSPVVDTFFTDAAAFFLTTDSVFSSLS